MLAQFANNMVGLIDYQDGSMTVALLVKCRLGLS